jgi:hypothetical protein
VHAIVFLLACESQRAQFQVLNYCFIIHAQVRIIALSHTQVHAIACLLACESQGGLSSNSTAICVRFNPAQNQEGSPRRRLAKPLGPKSIKTPKRQRKIAFVDCLLDFGQGKKNPFALTVTRARDNKR